MEHACRRRLTILNIAQLLVQAGFEIANADGLHSTMQAHVTTSVNCGQARDARQQLLNKKTPGVRRGRRVVCGRCGTQLFDTTLPHRSNDCGAR